MPHAFLEEGDIVEFVYMSLKGFVGNSENVPMLFELKIDDEYIKLENDERTTKKLPGVICKFDRDQIVRMLVNLISNAVVVSQGRGVPVVVSVESMTGSSMLKIKVKDYGDGLSKEVRSRLFEPYFSTKKTGTGLGLVIAKQIVDEHFGRIYVEENHPKGTVFVVEIPAINLKIYEDK
jgi:two-component system nitrogen regulation sensor histidine kinase NtrY